MKNPMVATPPAARAFQLLALTLLAASPGFADISQVIAKESFSSSCSGQFVAGCGGNGTGVLLIPQFNPNLGTLTGVDFEVILIDHVVFTLTNTSSNMAGIFAGSEISNANLTILTRNVVQSDAMQQFGAGLQPLQTYSGSRDCEDPGCGQFAGAEFSPPGSDPFIGYGFVDAPFTLGFGSDSRYPHSDPYVSLDQIIITTTIEADVRYSFAPVPEPSAWLLLATPTLILLARRKRTTA